MSKEKIYIFDTTLRDGAQTQGVDFSLNEKEKIAKSLDHLGVDYIEGGWPGANPTDTEFFNKDQNFKNANLTAFGMTKKSEHSANNDPMLSSLINSKSSSVCLFGKAWDFHVDVALGISNEENLENIKETTKHFVKNKKEFKIGIEHEKFLFDSQNNKRIDYQKIKEMFSALLEFGWNPVLENDNIIGLNKGGKNITLEPGNQIELSGDKLTNIHEACVESHDYLFELKQVTKKLNIKIVSAGFDPISKLDEIPNNPKKRYKLMTKDMPLGGELSLDMMYRTCGTQLNLDYSSEEDFKKKFKIINYLVPISIALFANSSIVEKKKSNYLSYRSKVWQNTSRGGLPKLFLEDFDFEKYADFVINFPILFIQQKENYFSGIGYNFSDFMSGNIKEINNRLPDENDLSTHLSTIFTENRLKKYIELRSMDTCGWDCLCAGPAFNVGMLYGNLDEVYQLVSSWDKDKIINAYLDAPQKGFNTQLMGKDLLYWASVLLDLSKKGLEKRDIVNKSGKNETIFLNHLQKVIDNKTTNAHHMIIKFSKDEDLTELYDK